MKTKKVTVEQLIKRLQTLPKKMGVVTNGYEGGYRDVGCSNCGDLSFVSLKRDVNDAWYFGPHDEETQSGNTQGRQKYLLL